MRLIPTRFVTRAALLLVAACQIPLPVSAIITSIGPLGGAADLTESFEAFPTGAFADGAPIMGGAANLFVATTGSIYNESLAPFSLGGSNAKVADGLHGFAATYGSPGIVFVEPTFSFGGYFGGYNGGVGSPRSTISAIFYDNNGDYLDTQTFACNALTGDLEWHGWHSDVAIKTVNFFDDGPANEMVMDQLEAVAVPEVSHAVVGVALVGLVAFVLRREWRARQMGRAID